MRNLLKNFLAVHAKNPYIQIMKITENKNINKGNALEEFFGEMVLDILEQHEEWSSDTVDAISEVAKNLGLCYTDNYGMFRVKKN